MDLKTNISLLFVILFLGKLVAFDANLLNRMYGNDAISVVKPFCKKKLVSHETNNFNDISTTLSFEVKSFCTPLFSAEIEKEEPTTKEFSNSYHRYQPAVLAAILEYGSPPPRV